MQVRAALDLLGDSGDEVAARLAAAGVRGRRSDQSGCPVARYLQALGLVEVPVERLEVTRTHAVLSDGRRWSRRARIELPPGVRAFVAGFDRGQFTHLRADPALGVRPAVPTVVPVRDSVAAGTAAVVGAGRP